MTTVAFLDKNFPFSNHPRTAERDRRTQAHTVSLAETFCQHNLQTTVFGSIYITFKTFGVEYKPISDAGNDLFDLVIANNNPQLFKYTKSKNRILWIHDLSLKKNLSLNFVLSLIRYRPVIIFPTDLHKKGWSFFLPFFPNFVIPYGINQAFLEILPSRNTAPAPCAIIVAHQPYNLTPMINLWIDHIHPRVPKARLNIYTEKQVSDMEAMFESQENSARGRKYASVGINFYSMPPRLQMIKEFCSCRVLLSSPEDLEGNGLTVFEAQALGLPVVTTNTGDASNHIYNGLTGFIAKDSLDYANSVVKLLTDNALWKELHSETLLKRNFYSWHFAATLWKQLSLSAHEK